MVVNPFLPADYFAKRRRHIDRVAEELRNRRAWLDAYGVGAPPKRTSNNE